MDNNVVELAKLIKNGGKDTVYSPMLGTILDTETLTIQLGNHILLYAEDIISTINLSDENNLNKTVVLLPYSNDQKFICVGVVQ